MMSFLISHPFIVFGISILLGVPIGIAIGLRLERYGVEMLVQRHQREMEWLERFHETRSFEERRVTIIRHLQSIEKLQEQYEGELDEMQAGYEEETRGLRIELSDALARVDALSQHPSHLARLPGFQSRDRSREPS